MDEPFDCGYRDYEHPQADVLGWCKAHQTGCTEDMERECAAEYYANENPDFAEFLHEGRREAYD